MQDLLPIILSKKPNLRIQIRFAYSPMKSARSLKELFSWISSFKLMQKVNVDILRRQILSEMPYYIRQLKIPFESLSYPSTFQMQIQDPVFLATVRRILRSTGDPVVKKALCFSTLSFTGLFFLVELNDKNYLVYYGNLGPQVLRLLKIDKEDERPRLTVA